MRNASGIKIIANSSVPENTIMIRGEIKQETKINIEEIYPKNLNLKSYIHEIRFGLKMKYLKNFIVLPKEIKE